MDIVKVGISVFCVICVILGVIIFPINLFLMRRQNIYTAQAFSYLLFSMGLIGAGLGGFYILNNAYFPPLIFLLSIVVIIAGLLGAAFIPQPDREVDRTTGDVWIRRTDGGPGYAQIKTRESKGK